MGLADKILFLIKVRKLKVITISLIGSMGEGKTNFMRYLSSKLHDEGFKQYYTSDINVTEVPDILNKLSGASDKVAIYLDDISFSFSGTSREVKNAENALSKIRHILNNTEGTTVLCMAYHYSRAVNPFLRQVSKVIVLFDISRHEISTYEEFFTRRYLREFLAYYDAWVWLNPKLVKKMESKGMNPFEWRPVLARIINRETITWIPLVKEGKWEIITRGEDESKSKEEPKHIEYLLKRLRKLREKGVIKLTGKYIYIKIDSKEVPFMKREVAEELGIV